MSPSSFPMRSLQALSKALHAREISAPELAEESLRRAAQAPDAVLWTNPELTRAQAQAAQAALDRGEAGPLVGLPLVHKDVFVTQGLPSTAGSKILEGYMSPFDAEVVGRLQAAGMVTVGKASCDEFAMGSSNLNCAYGPCFNPWARDRVPGGSSGGSAAAVAAGIVPAATGTDTGGSVRQPASYCGITGLKPTYGRVSRYGMIAYASSLDQAGPMAQSALDCAWMLAAMGGHDPKDATSSALAMPSSLLEWEGLAADAGRPLQGLRLGVPEEFFGAGLDAAVAHRVDEALRALEALGARRVSIRLPRTELSIPAYYVIAPAEASSNLSRFDGVRYGHRTAQADDLASLYSRSRSEGFGPEVQRRILVGTFVLSHGYYDAYTLQAQKVRRLVAQDFTQAFEACDLIVGPVAPTVAPRAAELESAAQANPLADYLSDIYTLGASLAGLPAMSVPAGLATPAGGGSPMPVGLQLIAPAFEEARLLSVAHRLQLATDWHLLTPEASA